ncbi:MULTISPECIES: gluconokinase [unclassified Roseateles]|uniref:gluconokinase n=1 Tax=unclassified Roseateles TaxID=2626991 RepID=UPI0006F4A9E7|nr:MULTISPECIES: gluconokinase [unclassified Roseateles]KQW41148.1 gluconokinase [Pelomonas sp. Root405]KRA67920.1 gluconokinase [Pelomonas sp. Root662]
MTLHAPESLIVMGVAGCGKSTLAACVADRMARPLVEGDHFHSESSRLKMAQGVPLNDDDRASWLASLCLQLKQHPSGAVVACSALKRSYRDQLRRASPGLRFAFLDIAKAEACRRVQARSAHFFAASLIDSQFETLEPPVGEPGVLRLDALKPLDELQADVCQWLGATS